MTTRTVSEGVGVGEGYSGSQRSVRGRADRLVAPDGRLDHRDQSKCNAIARVQPPHQVVILIATIIRMYTSILSTIAITESTPLLVPVVSYTRQCLAATTRSSPGMPMLRSLTASMISETSPSRVPRSSWWRSRLMIHTSPSSFS